MIADFFRSQLDYILFLNGLAFILLAPICQILKRRSQPPSVWVWLGAFGAVHGANELLGLLALGLGSGSAFKLARLVLATGSFVFLMEFGRAGTLTLRGRPPGRWILAALLGVALLGFFAGLPGFSAVSRYVLGVGGGLWAAATLYWASKATGVGSRALQGAALGMFGYALSNLVVAPAPFFPAAQLNSESFLMMIGLPIQLVQGLLALWLCGCLGLLAQASLPPETEHRIRVWGKNLMLGGLVAVTALLVAGWFTTQYFGREARRNLISESEYHGKTIQAALQDKMMEADNLVKTMVGSPWLLPALTANNAQNLENANAVLDRYSAGLPNSLCYLMDSNGLAIASSIRHRPDSQVGHSYQFRPYFQEAIRGTPGRYWALGVTHKELGYFATAPVRDPSGKIVGVAVIKRTLGDVTALFPPSSQAFVIDQRGIVVLSNRPEMVYNSLWPLSPGVAEEVIASRQFGTGPFPPILDREPGSGAECQFQGQRQLVYRLPLGWQDWSIVILSPYGSIVLGRLWGIIITMLSCFVVIGLIIIIGLTIDASARIQSSEGRYRLVFENTPVGILHFDKTGTVTDCNEKFAEIIGVPKEKIIRFNLSRDLRDEKLKEAVLAAVQGQVGFYEGDYLSVLGGKKTSLRAVFQGIVSPAGERLGGVGIFDDITERKKAEEALAQNHRELQETAQRLEQSMNMLQLVIESIPARVFWKDRDLRYLGCNTLFARDAGLNHPQQLLGQDDFTMGWKDQADLYRADDRQVMESRHPKLNIIEPQTTPTGATIWLNTSKVPLQKPDGEVFGVLGVYEDITARINAEKELKTTVAVLENIIASSADPLATVDEQGRFTRWNQAAEEAYGYNAEALAGHTPFELDLYADKDAMERMLNQLRRDGFVRGYEIDMQKKDKVIAPFSLSIRLLRDENGETTGSVCVARDLTETKKALTALGEANARLQTMVEESDRRSREATLIANMSESLQSCLYIEEAYSVIAGFAQKLFSGLSGALFIMAPAKNTMEVVTAWGDPLVTEKVFAPKDCWAIRRGRVYLSGQEVPCHHLPNLPTGFYVCLPLVAQGDAFGLMHLEGIEKISPVVAEQLLLLARTVADHTSLALANLQLRETLRFQVIHDELTGLFNRRYLDETLKREILRVQRKKAPLGVIMMDLDHFKRFNDTYGHEAGDDLLQALGNFLQTQVRQEDIACRYGGEEFVLILPEASLDVIQKRAEEVRQGVSELQVSHRGRRLEMLTISSGVALFPDHGATWEDLLRAADTAMYRAKQEGRNRVVVAGS